MAGLVHHGANRLTYVANLKKAAKLAAKQGVDLLIEPINTRDIPGFLVNRTADALAIIGLVGEPNVKLQFDLYHRQIMEGDLVAAVSEFAAIAPHMQIAQPPDRGEPDSGEINYPYLFKLIDDAGFKGWIGCEYKPRGDTVKGLAWVGKCGLKGLGA
jgi:2-dehydrotetronate isomerase